MKIVKTKNRILWIVSMLAIFGIAYWLCRFTLYDLHGMKQWPDFLAISGIAIIIITSIIGNREIPVATVIGYILGFIISMLFNTDGVDLGGGKTNNAWIIWGAVFLISILIGTAISTYKSKHNE